MANPTVNTISAEAPQFFNTLQAQQQLAFGENQAALDTISKAWAPVLSTGAVPYGFSPGLDSLLQANVLQTGATATTNAINAAELQEKQAAGGANVMPTGAQAQINAEIQAQGQQSTARGLQAEKVAGYEEGLKNLEAGTQAELGVAEQTDPNKYSAATTGAGNLALSAGAEQFKENQANSMFSKVMQGFGAVGGLAKDIGLGFAGGVPSIPTGGGGGVANLESGGTPGGNDNTNEDYI